MLWTAALIYPFVAALQSPRARRPRDGKGPGRRRRGDGGGGGHRPGARPLLDAPDEAPAELRRIGWDSYLGLGYSSAIAYRIILSATRTPLMAVVVLQAGVNRKQASLEGAAEARGGREIGLTC
jgi:hypothetical protein